MLKSLIFSKYGKFEEALIFYSSVTDSRESSKISLCKMGC